MKVEIKPIDIAEAEMEAARPVGRANVQSPLGRAIERALAEAGMAGCAALVTFDADPDDQDAALIIDGEAFGAYSFGLSSEAIAWARAFAQGENVVPATFEVPDIAKEIGDREREALEA